MKNALTGAISRASLLACGSMCAVSSVDAASGTWTGTITPGLWSDAANWSSATIASGSGSTADFSTLDLPDGQFIAALDTPRTLGSLTFGDADPASPGSWLIDNNVDPANILTLAGTPTITVNALGALATAGISAEIAGTEGLVKAGPGTLSLSGPNTYSGTTTVNAGTLNLGSATAIGTGPLVLAGGDLGTTGTAVTLATNNPQTWSADFSFTGPSNLNVGTGAVDTGGVAREITSIAGNLITGGVVTAPGLTKSGVGTVTLHGNNLTTLTGPRLFKAGTLALLGAAPGSNAAANQGNTQRALGDTTGTLTFEGGTLALNGSTFADNATGWGNLANPITVAAGQSGTLNCPPRGALTSIISGAGTLHLGVRNTRWDFNANLAGFTGALHVNSTIHPAFGDLRVNGSGQFATTRLHLGPGVYMAQIFNPPNNTAGTTQNIGELSGDAGSILAGQPVNGRFVNWMIGALGTDSTFAGTIANGTGACRVYKVGTGTLTLTGNNTYTGNAAGIAGTQISAGTLAIGDGGATGSLGATDVSVAAGTTLVFNRDNSAVSTYPGILSGAGNVIKRGAGQVNFHGVNTYTAGTSIEGGVIGVNSAASLGNAAGPVNFTIADGGILATVPGVIDAHIFHVAAGLTASFGAATAADSLEVTTPVTGAGNLAVHGLGVLTLSNANTHAGTTTVNSGTLVAANLAGSATSAGPVALDGGRLGGTGIITGVVSAATGTELKPGPLTPSSSGVGTLTAGGLDLAGGTVFRMELTDSANYDKIVVTGANALTSSASLANPVLVDPRVANSTAKWTTPGTYDIIRFSGAFAGNPDDLFEVPVASRQVGLTYSFVVNANHIRLQIGGSPPSVWSTDSSGNWSDPAKWLNGVPDGPGGFADLGPAISAPRTITLDGDRTLGLLQVNNANAYTIGGTSTLHFDQTIGDAEISVLLGNHTISAPISLVDSLAITLNTAGDSLSILGNIGGAGGLIKSSPGNLTLGGNNSALSGDIAFGNGTLTFATDGLGTGNLALDNASLVWDSGNSQDITAGRTVTFGDSPVTFAMEEDVVLSSDFGGAGTANLTKDGFGQLTLAADTTFSGNLRVLNGNLTFGTGGTTGSTAGAIDLADPAGVLTVRRSGDPVIGNLISGAGSLVLDGTGTTALTHANTFSGATTIHGGSLLLANPLALQNSTLLYNTAGGPVSFGANLNATFGALDGDKDLHLENSDLFPVTLTVGGNHSASTYTGTLSGAGSFTKVGTGVMVLTGAHTFSGATQVNGGALELESTVTLDNTTVGAGATGRLTSHGATISASLPSNVTSSGAGGAVFQQFSGSANFAGGLNGNGNANQQTLIQVDGGTLTAASMQLGRTAQIITAEPAAGSVTDGLSINGGDVDITGALNMGTVSAANSTVNVRIDSGSLDVGGPIVVGLNNGGRWSVVHVAGGTFTSTDPVTGVQLGGPLPGNAAFLTSGGIATVERFQLGQGALGGSGVVHVSGGELRVGSGGMVVGTSEPDFVATLRLSGGVLAATAPWSTAIPVATSATFGVKTADAANAPHDITLSGPVTGTGSLLKEGAGTLTLAGSYTYSGSTEIEAGTLVLDSASLSDTATVDVSAIGGASLHLPHGLTDTVADFRIDGISQGPGTFHVGNSNGRITGSGSLFVPVADPFVAWIAGFPAVGPLTGKNDDADSDGLSNLQEFAFDSDPSSGFASGKIRSRIEAVGAEHALVITLPVRIGAVFAGAPEMTATIDELIYTVEGGNGLGDFDQAVSEIAVSAAGMPALNPGWSYRSFRLAGAIPERGATGFLRAGIQDAAP
jgi:autotransporter-associated beta strand protein